MFPNHNQPQRELNLPQHMTDPRPGYSTRDLQHQIDNMSFTEENMPTLHAQLDLHEFNAEDLMNKNLLNQSNYDQWQVDRDDCEDQKLVEDLRKGLNMKRLGTCHQEDLASPKGLICTPTKKEATNDKQKGEEEKLKTPKNNRQTSNSGQKKMKPVKSFEDGETLISEYVPDLNLEQKNSNSKDSSMRDDVLELSPAPPTKKSKKNITEENRSQQSGQVKKTERFLFDEGVEEEDNEHDVIKMTATQQQSKDLKNSDIQALYKKLKVQVQQSVKFNVMVAGQSGLGKSTFVDAFLNNKYQYEQIRPSTTTISEREGKRQYDGMEFKIKFIDTPGFNYDKSINEWYSNIKEYITSKFDEYKQAKSKKNKEKKAFIANQKIDDNRVHALLYFISGPRISEKDIYIMKKLKKYCNIIPILAKGDSYTIKEIKEIKQNFLSEAHDSKLEWFDFEEALKSSPAKLAEIQNRKFGPCPPFLLISSVKKVMIAPQRYVFGREYTWGICNIEDPNHSDFTLLQTLLGGYICMQAIQLTHFFYKQYHKKVKEQKEELRKEKTKQQIGLGAMVAFGLFGAYMAVKDKVKSSLF